MQKLESYEEEDVESGNEDDYVKPILHKFLQN